MCRYCLFCCVLLLFIAAAGCSFNAANPENENKHFIPLNGDKPAERDPGLRETVFYLPDKNWQILVPVKLYIPWEEGIAKAVLRQATEEHFPPEAKAAGLAPLLPAGTRVLGMSIREGLAKVDFSREFSEYLPERERLLLTGIIYTLTEFPAIDRVEILLEGEKADFSGQNLAGFPLGRELGLNHESPESAGDAAQKITLYFLYTAGEDYFYVPVSRAVPETKDWLLTVAGELFKGPRQKNVLSSAVPAGIKLKSAQAEGGKVVLHLEGETAAGGSETGALRLQQQTALTFTEIEGITEVSLLVEGNPLSFSPEITLPAAFGRPKEWNVLN